MPCSGCARADLSSVMCPVVAVQEPKDADAAGGGGGDAEDGMEEGEERDEPKPQPLHRTQSIFLRSLPPLVTRQEIDEVRWPYPSQFNILCDKCWRFKCNFEWYAHLCTWVCRTSQPFLGACLVVCCL